VIGRNKQLGPTDDNTDLLMSQCICHSCQLEHAFFLAQ